MSETHIANLALGRLDIGQAISSLSEQSNPARQCNRFFAQARREVLRSFPWPFATRSVLMAQVADETFPGWRYLYQYPSHCLLLRFVGPQDGIRAVQTYFYRHDWTVFDNYVRHFPFQLTNRSDGNIGVLSDLESAWAFYTVDVTNTGVFPADFTNALAWRLAMEIAGPLGKSRAEATQNYMNWRREAMAQALNEGADDFLPEPESIRCRM
jgi:hypothetical protein